MGKAGGVLDYVGCWFKLAAEYMQGTKVQAALVASNSITQGQQVEPLWKPLFDEGLVINFAHRSFVWTNDSNNAAHVHVVIVGFGYQERETKTLFSHSKNGEVTVEHPANINAYLAPAPNVFISKQSKPLGNVPPMAKGFQPTDGGNLLLSPQEYNELLRQDPSADKWIRPFNGAGSFIKDLERYCLWLVGFTPDNHKHHPLISDRVQHTREWRLAQTSSGDAYKLADTPHLLRPSSNFKDGPYMLVPRHSSERRMYVPIDFRDDGSIPGDAMMFLPDATPYIFGVLMSRVHNAWMRTVCGRLKSDYRYSNTIVYNTLVWPEPTEAQRTAIETAAQAVLDARAQYPNATLADLYDPDNDWLYPALTNAHKTLDAAVERAYGLPVGCNE